MAITISGSNDNISAADGSLTIEGLTASGDLSVDSVTVGTGASVSSPATNVLTLGTNDTERVRINSSGNVGIGTDNPGAPLDVVTNSSAEGIRVRGRSSDSIGSLYFYNHASATPYGLVQGRSTDFRLGSESNTPVIFNVNGSEVARFNTSGNLAFPSGQGIDFSATSDAGGMTSELLDDYEEGTWTPTIDLSVSSPTYSKQEGKYTKIGNVVNVSCTLAISSGTTDGSTFRVGGFPFSALNLNDRAFTGIVRVNSVSSNGEKLYVFMNTNASTAFLNTQTATGSGGFTGNQFGTTGSISFSLTYIEA